MNDVWPKGGSQDHGNTAWRREHPSVVLYRAAKSRATRAGLAFDITWDDVVIPEVCPYLKKPLVLGTAYAPSLDRIDNTKGYVKGNVEVISRKANTMKNDASNEELLEFAYTILERN